MFCFIVYFLGGIVLVIVMLWYKYLKEIRIGIVIYFSIIFDDI